MSDASQTPPYGVPALWARESECAHRHERTNKVALEARSLAHAAHNRLNGLTGIDGGRGRVGELESDMRRVAEILESVQKSQERQGVKLAVMWAAASLVGGGVAAGVLRLAMGV